MSFKIEVDADHVIAKFDDMSTRIPEKMGRVVQALTLKLYSAVVQRAPIKTGRLRQAILQMTTINRTQAIGRVYVSSTVPYARIQEYGGKTSAHDIYPSKAKTLAFMMGGKQAFFKHVHHPGSKIPAKLYLHGPFEEMKSEIVAQIEGAVREALK